MNRALARLQQWLRGLSPRMAGWVVLVVSGLASAVWLMDGERQREQALKLQARQVAESRVYALQTALQRNLAVLDVLAALVSRGQGEMPEFDSVARSLLATRPELLAMGLLPQGVVAQVVPEQVGQSVLGMDVLKGPRASADAQLAVQSGSLALSLPSSLPMGGEGLTAHMPVYLSSGHAFWGLVRTAVSWPAFLVSGRFERFMARGFDYELRTPIGDVGQPPRVLATSLADGHHLAEPLEVPVNLYNQHWVLAVAPTKGWLNPLGFAFKLLWALLFSAGGAALVVLTLQRLRQTQSVLQNLTDQVPGAVYQYRLDREGLGWFPFVSAGMVELTGLSTQELQASDRPWLDLVHPDDRLRLRAAVTESARSMGPLDLDFRIRNPRGQVRWLWTRAKPQRDADGDVVWSGYLADWTHEKETEDALLHSNRLLGEAQEVARLGYFITDADTGNWTSSALLDDIFGIDENFARTTAGWTSLVQPEYRDVLRGAYQRAVAEQAGFMVEFQLCRPRDGRIIWVHALGRLEFDAGGQPLRIVGTVQDISHRKKAEADIRHLAYFDPLTGLPNRRMLLERLSNALHDRALDGQHGALMFIDLDHFKDLNDSLGHDQGDALLQMVALRLLGCVADNDTVSRLGGDEFVLLLSWLVSPPQETAMQTAERVAQRVIAALGRPYTLGGTSHTSTPSIGITLFAGEGLGVDEVIKRADVAMYQAKAAGRNTLRFFDPRIQAETAQRLQLAEDLRDAIAHDQLSLQYQPQHDDAGRLVGAEALLRWTHPVRGPVSPAVFIPLAEQVGLIESLGQWVLHTACQQLKTWLQHPDLQGWHQGFSMAVNVSAHQFRSRTFVEDVQREVLRAGLTPGLLKLELTESLMVHDVEDIIEKMKAIRPLGVHFSLDDFGTGYSSLTYLKRLPLDQLKIDQSFVRDLLTDPNDAGIARTVVALGQTLGLEVIAEGVETLEQRQCLADMGCRVYQGYLFSRPIKPDEFMAYALSCIK